VSAFEDVCSPQFFVQIFYLNYQFY